MNGQMKETDPFDLDQELKNMARDVPEMPEEFRAGWRQALRAEAAAFREDGAEQSAPAPSAMQTENASADDRQENAAAAGPEAKKSPPLRKFIPLVSAAAVLLFLIGGTLATRGMLSPRLKANSAVDSSSPDMQTEMAAEAPEEKMLTEEKAMRRAATESEAVESEAMEAAILEDMAMEEAVEYGYMAAESYMAAGSDMAAESDTAAESNMAVEGNMTAEGNTAAESGTNSRVAGGGSIPSEKPAPTVPPARAASDTQDSGGAATGSPASAESPDFAARLGYFLEDMGAFLLAALPYLAGAGVLALIAVLIGKRRKSK